MIMAVLFISLAILLILNVPIAVSLAVSSISAMLVGGMASDLVVLAQKLFTSMDSFPFMAVPFFMLSGEIMTKGGISKRLIEFASALVGWLPGGMGIVTVVSSGFFGAISGSNAATTAAIGSIMIPAMEDSGYPKDYATTVAASAGTLGVVVPPSTPMITYGVISGVSIAALFAAGIVPALIMIITMSILLIFQSKKHNYPTLPFNLKRLGKSTYRALGAILMPVLILGSIYAGIATPTEAAAISVAYALIVSMFVYKELKLEDLKPIIVSAGKTTAVVLFVIATSGAFSWIMVTQNMPATIANFVLGISNNPILIALFINILLLILGVFLETNAVILMVAPILIPIGQAIGISPLTLGIIMVVNTSVGMITPPMALNIIIASGISGVSIERVAKKIVPFLIILIIDIIIITYIPGLIEFLPRALGLIV